MAKGSFVNDWVDAEQHVERAHELYERGRWSEAESELRSAIAVNPYQAEWHFNLGLTLEAAGRYAEAAAAFIEAAELQPGEWNASLSAAANLLEAGRAEDSLTWLDRASEAGADPTEADVHRIEALTELRRFEDAELVFYMAQQRGEDHPGLYAAMGDALVMHGDHDRALWCFREAARLDPELPQVYSRLARVHDALGRHERARQLYLRELRSDPGDIDTLLDIADLLRRMQRPAESSEKLRRVLELDPRCAEAHAALAELSELGGDHEAAIAQMDVAVRLDPAIPEGRLRLAVMLIARGREADAPRIRELLDAEIRAHAQAPDPDAHSLSRLGEALLDAARPSDAARVFATLIELEPDRLDNRHLLSVALLEMGQLDAGMAQAREIIRRHPRSIEAMHNLALAHMRRGDWLRARYWVSQALQTDPEDAPIRRLRTRLRLRTGMILASAAARGLFALGRLLYGLVLRPSRPASSPVPGV